ncbi:MAG: hypothetical protein AMXMBFR7_46530 [Planctomycetota bacterium]
MAEWDEAILRKFRGTALRADKPLSPRPTVPRANGLHPTFSSRFSAVSAASWCSFAYCNDAPRKSRKSGCG